ncbi:hypothetical protein AM571_PA00138 (plasmid) [Rhizobium etli 8C-3]|uniref:Uncharacterized protein n=1 Tax=Rhizobium etli 8C-3 TaxID=538025 RepID=A0A1L5PA93_RHIET|nr:hypothetical protein AM571_PA00138 [Rhizobium etli 8C-3]
MWRVPEETIFLPPASKHQGVLLDDVPPTGLSLKQYASGNGSFATVTKSSIVFEYEVYLRLARVGLLSLRHF